MVFSGFIALHNGSVDQLQLVAGVVICKLHLNHLVHRKTKFNGLQIHPFATEDLTGRDDIVEQICVLVEKKRWGILVQEVLNTFSSYGTNKLGMRVFFSYLIKQLIKNPALHNTTLLSSLGTYYS